MFSPRLPKTPVSNARNRSVAHGRSSGVFTPPTRRNVSSPFSPMQQSFNQSRNFYSVLEEGGQSCIVSYGAPLPVLVIEAVNEACSVRLDENGWACLVGGRKLLIWNYEAISINKNTIQCRGLTLPPSDLAHKADLAHVCLWNESQVPSALAVSPEGLIRYWHNIVHENSSVDASTDLQGQECHSLINVSHHGYVLATTTGSLVLISPTLVDGQPVINCRPLKVPQGVLAGMGRRVSSFIFGALPAQTSESKQLNKVLSINGNEGTERFLFVLCSCTFQKWVLRENEPDQLLYERSLDRCLKDYFFRSFWVTCNAAHIHSLKNWCLDMQLSADGITILAAATNTHSSDKFVYALATFNPSEDVPAIKFSSFYPIKFSESYQVDAEEKLLSYKFLLPSRSNPYAYVYNTEKVYCAPVTSDTLPEHDIFDIFDLHSYGHILGAGVFENLPLVFSEMYGVLSLQSPQMNYIDANLHLESLDTEAFSESQSEDQSSQTAKLRSALCLFFSDGIEKSQEILQEMYPASMMPETDSEFDRTVIALSKQIIDDYPLSDPRWLESVPTGDSVSSSLIILHQLDDKLKVHEYLINFLRANSLFDKLTAVSHNNILVSTGILLCEHAEKIVAAKVLRRFILDFSDILLPIIEETLESRKLELKPNLTHQDIFFREVSAIDTVFEFLIKWEEQQLTEEEQVVRYVDIVNSIFSDVIQSITQYRVDKSSFYGLPERNPSGQNLPWTSDESVNGFRTILLKQHSINVQYMFNVSNNLQVQGALFKQIVEIVDFLLSGLDAQLHSVPVNELYQLLKSKFEKQRSHLIRPLLGVEQYERAAALAERYQDFDIILEICEATNNQELLKRYMLQFKAQGFSDYMFEWYLKKGLRDKLLAHPLVNQDELSLFLQDHHDLSWLHHIKKQNYDQAHRALLELATKETDFVSKKKTQLSLSKLSIFVSDLPPEDKDMQINEINTELNLIVHHEQLPEVVLEALGLNADSMRVLSPEELIEMYISDENSTARAFHFKMALELLVFFKKPPGDEEYESLRLHIWCKALLRDNWDELDTNYPWEAVKDTVFFQVMQLTIDQGEDLHEFMIPVTDLLQSPELSGLRENPNFSFLLGAGYEQILKIIE